MKKKGLTTSKIRSYVIYRRTQWGCCLCAGIMGIFLSAGCEKEQESAAPARTSVNQVAQETESGEKPQGKPWVPDVAVEAIGQDQSMPDQKPAPEAIAKMDETDDPVAAIDEFRVEKFTFKFHRETQDEICGDAEHFIYNGSMMIVGQIQSAVAVAMDAHEFELELITPFESYILPAWQAYESPSGQSRFEQVFVRKGEGAVFVVKGFHTQEDEVVYRDDDDETGTLENFGPVIDAVFDWEKQRYVLSVTRAELIAEDIKRGELLDLSLLMSDFSPGDEDFDQTIEFRYNGEPIDSDNYDYNGDCP